MNLLSEMLIFSNPLLQLPLTNIPSILLLHLFVFQRDGLSQSILLGGATHTINRVSGLMSLNPKV